MLKSELVRLEKVHEAFLEVYEEQSRLVRGLGLMLNELEVRE
jgi:hypothetical protein